jgi:hypothetical protein
MPGLKVRNDENSEGHGHVIVRLIRGSFKTAEDVRSVPAVTELLQLIETCPLPPNKHGIVIAPSGTLAAVKLDFTNNSDLKEFREHFKTLHPDISFFALKMPPKDIAAGEEGFNAFMAGK